MCGQGTSDLSRWQDEDAARGASLGQSRASEVAGCPTDSSSLSGSGSFGQALPVCGWQRGASQKSRGGKSKALKGAVYHWLRLSVQEGSSRILCRMR